LNIQKLKIEVGFSRLADPQLLVLLAELR